MILFFKSSMTRQNKTIVLGCKDVTTQARALVISRGIEQAGREGYVGFRDASDTPGLDHSSGFHGCSLYNSSTSEDVLCAILHICYFTKLRKKPAFPTPLFGLLRVLAS